MKKVITLTTIISVILLGIVSSYASSNIAVNLTGNTKVKEGTKTIELTLSLGSFTDIKTDEILAVGYETTINYDDTLVKSVAVQGLNSWSATYEGSTKKLIGELDDSAIKQFKANTNIAKITITLKDDLKAGTIGKIKLNDLVLAYGDTKDTYDFTYNKEVTVTIEANATNSQEQSGTENTGSDKNSDDKNKQENITNNEQQNKDEAKNENTINTDKSVIVQEEIMKVISKIKQIERESDKRISEWQSNIALITVNVHINFLKSKYKRNKKINKFLNDVKQDVLKNKI